MLILEGFDAEPGLVSQFMDGVAAVLRAFKFGKMLEWASWLVGHPCCKLRSRSFLGHVPWPFDTLLDCLSCAPQ